MSDSEEQGSADFVKRLRQRLDEERKAIDAFALAKIKEGVLTEDQEDTRITTFLETLSRSGLVNFHFGGRAMTGYIEDDEIGLAVYKQALHEMRLKLKEMLPNMAREIDGLGRSIGPNVPPR